jgi:hypothetical protein
MLVLSFTADAAAGPVYRDPPTYRGTTKAPATVPPPLPAPATLSATGGGTFPDLLVDEAGTAHIVWNESRGDESDAATYCRLKRGATDCEVRATLTWEKEYGTGDGPQFNNDYQGPRIVRVGDQLVVLSKRYPTGSTKPDGGSSHTTLLWVSNDGGSSWPNAQSPAIVGKYNLGEAVVVGPPEDPTILDLAYDPFCGMCLVGYKSGQYTKDAGNLSTGPNQSYYASLARGPDGLPVAGFTDNEANAFIRRWSGTGSVMDPGTWSAPVGGFKADDLSLAGGPGGVFAMGEPGLIGQPYEVRRLSGPDGGAPAVGPPTRISDTGVGYGRLEQTPAGRLIAAWSKLDGATPGVFLRTAPSPGGLDFAEPQRLADGATNSQINLAAAADSGGFAVFNRSGGCCDPGELAATGFGNPAPTGQPGIGNVEGGGNPNVTCQSVKFGRFTVDTAAGCFLEASGANRGLVVSGNEIELNGLRIVPDAGVKITIDPKRLRIDTSGDVRVIATAPVVGDFVLWHGQIHRDLSKAVPGSNLFEFPAGEFKAELFGFDLGADIPVRLEDGGVRIPVDLKLPKAFGGFTGHAELIARKGRGLIVDSLAVHIGPLPLGVLTVDALDITYSGAEDRWTGSGSVTVPAGGTLAARASFLMGDFESASISFTPATPIPVGPFVYLLRIGGEFEVTPIHIGAEADFGLGAAVNGESPIRVDGRFDMTFPSNGDPAHFKLGGTVTVLMFEAGNAFLEFYTDGYAAFGGQVGPLELGPLTMDARLGGFVDAGSGAFGASFDGKFEVCVVLGCGSADAEAAVNNVGFAVCVGFLGGRIGVRFPWEDFNPIMLVNPFTAAVAFLEHFTPDCNTKGYRTPPPRALRKAQAGGIAVDVAAGLPSQTILVKGDGDKAPRVAVSGPSGQSFDSNQPSAAGEVVYARGLHAAYVLLKAPAAGTWTVTPMEGSPGIAEVKLGDGYRPPSVKGSLGGKGRRRSISYRVGNLTDGQAVRFAERGAFGTRLLGAVTKSKGTLAFTPEDARGSRRTVIALVEQDGIVTDEVRLGTFTAPAPSRPGAPARLRAKRKASQVTVTWKPGSGTKQQTVRLRGRHTNLARLVSSKTRKVVFSAVRRDETVTIEVRGVSAKQRLGPVRKLRVRGGR